MWKPSFRKKQIFISVLQKRASCRFKSPPTLYCKVVIIGVACCLLQVLLSPVYAGEWHILGRDSITTIHVMEDHSEALRHWARQGIQNAVLINVDAHDDLRWIAPEKIASLRALMRQKDWGTFLAVDSGGDSGLYHPGTFIYAACKLGLVRHVYWIIPFDYFQRPDSTRQLADFLRQYGFSRQTIDTFALHEGCYEGSLFGIPLTICGIEHLPHIPEPVLLSIDADFFPPFAHWYNRDILTAMSVFFRRIADQAYSVQDVVIAHSVNGGFLSVARRWIAERCAEILSRPEHIAAPYSDLWLVRGLADIYYQHDRAQAVLDITRRFRKRYPQDPCLMAYQAFALLASGDNKGSFDLACGAVRLDKRYAFLLADLGQCLIDRGNLDEALQYFRAAYKAAPRMNFRQKNLADALMQAGRYREALYYYNIYRQSNGTYPVVFLMGEAALHLSDIARARSFFEQGALSLKRERYISVDCEIDAMAIRKAVSFLRQHDRPVAARRITEHPRLKKLFEAPTIEPLKTEGKEKNGKRNRF